MDSLDNYLIARIASCLLSPLNAPLRAVSARFRAIIAQPEKRTFRDLLLYGTKIGNRDLCVLAHSRDSIVDPNATKSAAFDRLTVSPTHCGLLTYDKMLELAACAGNRDLCILAREWGATDFNHMLWIATIDRNDELCTLAREWITIQNIAIPSEIDDPACAL